MRAAFDSDIDAAKATTPVTEAEEHAESDKLRHASWVRVSRLAANSTQGDRAKACSLSVFG